MSLTPSGLPAVQDDEKTMALVAHLCVFAFPVLGPLVLYLVKKDTSPFVAYHAIQAAIFQFAVFAGTMAATVVLSVITLGMCGWLGCIGYLAIFGAIPFALKAKNGEWAGYPLIGGIGMPAGMS